MGRRGVLVLSVLLVAAAGCASTEPEPSASDPPATASPSPAVPPEVSPVGIEVATSGAITMPEMLPAGAYEFAVSTTGLAELTLIEPAEDYAPSDLAADFGPHASEAEFAAAHASFEAQTRTLGGTWVDNGTATATFAIVLTAGTYWLVDLGKEPGEAGDDDVLDPANVHVLTVTGDGSGAVLPEPDGEAAATDDRSWSLPESLPASGTLLIRNETSGTHQLVLDPVPADRTAQEHLEQVRTGHRDCTCGSPARLGPGGEFLWSYELPPGDYVVLDHAIGDLGYPQYNGAGAVLLRLT